MTPIAAYTPFWNPLPVWDYWYTLLIPLSLGISIVYKSVKCHHMRQVPREATIIFLTILIGMIAAAAALMGLTRLLEWR
ncbi:MAG TPA: hypothetical protein VK986_17990 [Tepidisphaeraceae bacterium]|nr:hypothetical protein [Tepidisphaeraceae bacterium]